jgi:phosphoribosylaminoimidazole-succinocarboxamide synthase
MQTILQTKIPGRQPVRGKVRDIYDLGDKLLIVATDRISAFDVVMANGIPYKGIVLTQISKFWFDFLAGQVEHHLLSDDVSDLPKPFSNYARQLQNRSMLVRRCRSAHRVCRARVSGRIGLEGVSAERHGLRRQTAGRVEAMPEAARADLHALAESRARHP